MKICWNERKKNAFLLTELCIVAIALWYVTDYLFIMNASYHVPLNRDIKDTYNVIITQREKDSKGYIPEERLTQTKGEDILEIANRLRLHLAVENASVSLVAQPYITHDSYTVLHRDTLSRHLRCYMVDREFFDVFRIRAKNGSPFLLEDLLPEQLVLTADVEKDLFEGLSAVGKQIRWGEEESMRNICAVAGTMPQAEFRTPLPAFFYIMSDKGVVEMAENNWEVIEMSVRLKPDADEDAFRTEMMNGLNVQNFYLVDIQPIGDMRTSFLEHTVEQVKNRIYILLFLVLNAFLAVIGVFWFRTSRRTNEIGLRKAVGSTCKGIRHILFSEGIVLLILAMVPAMIIGAALGRFNVLSTYFMPFTLKRFAIVTALCFLSLCLIVLAGIYFPARRASKIHPVEALREE